MSKLRWYLAAIVLLGLVVVINQPWSLLLVADQKILLGAACLCALGILTERFSIQFAVSGKAASTSVAFIPLLASILAFERPFALGISITIATFGQFVFARRDALRGLFNIAQWALTVELAGLVYRSLGGHHGLLAEITLISAIGLTVTFFFANQFFVAVAVALNQGERIALTFARVISAAGANVLYDLLISPIAVVVAVLYQQYWIGGLLMVILPMLLIRHAYWSIQKLKRANEDILEVLIKTIDTRDPYTSGHSVRVAKLAKAIAEDLDLSTRKVDRVYMAALVHDIGKVEPIYADIIRKESSLTDAERRVILTHAAKGAEFLTTLSSFNDEVIAAVKYHHERYDGTGYPECLAGQAIPLAARIIMLCDSIDAMLSDRPYRKALSIEHVRAELLRCSGTQFDPAIVQAILARNTLERAASLVGPTERDAPRALKIAV